MKTLSNHQRIGKDWRRGESVTLFERMIAPNLLSIRC
jgi:hypothetical protein